MKKIILIIVLLSIKLSVSAQCLATGALNWDRPESFNSSTDTILVFAKLRPVGLINIEAPTKPPGTYGSPSTDLDILEGSIPADIQYENDPLAMLIYADTGECVEFYGTNKIDKYIFAVFNVAAGQYSNHRYAIGQLRNSVKITNILALVNRIQWAPIMYYDTAMVVIMQGGIPVGSPVGSAAGYLPGVNTDYSQSTSYFNGVDASDGKVLYIDEGNRFSLSGLSGFSYTVRIYTITDGCWGEHYDVTIDNIPDQ